MDAAYRKRRSTKYIDVRITFRHDTIVYNLRVQSVQDKHIIKHRHEDEGECQNFVQGVAVHVQSLLRGLKKVTLLRIERDLVYYL